MQVRNETAIQSGMTNEKALVLKEGEQLRATVKERSGNNEVTLRMKGQEVRVKFEGTLPSDRKIMIQVTDTSKELPHVKAIKTPVPNDGQAKASAPSPENLHIHESVKADLRKAVNLILAQGRNVSKSTMQELAVFLEKGEGTIEQKLETVAAMAKKALEFTPAQIKAVHTALHDSSFKNNLQDLIKGGSSQKTNSTKVEQIIQEFTNNVSTAQSDANSAIIKNTEMLIKALKKEPDMSQIFTMLKEQLTTSGALTDMQTEKLTSSIEKTAAMVESGRELAARHVLMNTLEQIKQQSSSQQQSQPAEEVYALTEEFISSLPVQSKDYIVSTITKKLSQMTNDFKNMQREMTRNLQNVQIFIKENQAQAKPMLEATIKQLDQAILKSDIMLYTDMTTEKKLLQASSRLAEARKLLAKGDTEQAGKIVREVQGVVEKIMFKPSNTRMQHFVSEKLIDIEQPVPQERVAYTAKSALQGVQDSPSGRQILEHLKSMGLTYETDKAHALISKENSETTAANLKEVLLKLSQSNQESALSQKAEQLTTSLTGQQLLSKTDTTSLQSMMFVLPILLKEQVEQVKVFVNSKNEQQKIDWENCSLYFLLETKKLGEVGILLSAVDRNLSITIKNDKPDFQEKIAPLAQKAKERLQEVGYQIGEFRFTGFSEEEKGEDNIKSEIKPALPYFTERGYDFTI